MTTKPRLSTENKECVECKSFQCQGNFMSASTMYICTNKESDHYGHVIATQHPQCKEFVPK